MGGDGTKQAFVFLPHVWLCELLRFHIPSRGRTLDLKFRMDHTPDVILGGDILRYRLLLLSVYMDISPSVQEGNEN